MTTLPAFTKVAKAIAAGVGAAATYLIATLAPDATSFSDVTLVQWLGLIPTVLAVYSITWRVPNAPIRRTHG